MNLPPLHVEQSNEGGIVRRLMYRHMFGQDVAPDFVAVGPGNADITVVCNIHGDEPTGARVIRRILDQSPESERAVKSVVANTPASILHRRALDVDINRVFPGEPETDDRERPFAAQLVKETATCDTISFHPTPETVAFVSEGQIVSQIPISYVITEAPVVGFG